MTTNRKKGGFTLLELIVTVSIIAILATLVGIRVIPFIGKSKIDVAHVQIAMLEEALDAYRLDTGGKYPSQEQGLKALCEKPTVPPVPEKYAQGGYLKGGKVPLDPWGNPYVYLVDSDRGQYRIVCYGADGEPDGEGENADIASDD